MRTRQIDEQEIEQALAVLASPDPAGILGSATREDVACVAAYMNPVRGRIIYFSPLWRLIVRNHPAARAIFYHELEEMNALVNLGVQVPAEIDRMGELFLKAHALASWKEAEYWEAWARAEGEVVSQQAFLFGHPWRAYRELEAVAKLLRTVGVEVHRPSGRELAEAERFYAGKGVTRQVPW